MSARIVRATLFSLLAFGLCFQFAAAGLHPGEPNQERTASAGVVSYNQPPDPNGGLLQSSWWSPNEGPFDHYVWDNFTLESAQVISEIHWRGGYDPARGGSGGPVSDFTVAIFASIPAGTQPDVANPPMVQYQTGGKAGETLAGTFGGVAMYDYAFVLPVPFPAAAGVKYWLYIVAPQSGTPDWGLSAGTGGDGGYYHRIHQDGDVFQSMPGDAAFSLFAAGAAPSRTPASTRTPTLTLAPAPTTTTTPGPAPAFKVYLPISGR
jgi:hypothetical protein